ncbi:outer membrane beta-barrel protein [Terrihabitans sp. B22-R8]|uniref:outer membrane beta-barrel protein n=1 Tax=Terrihabitans sp. B22-R8 TaxID=3425128 RepID=UPI00403C3306
MRFSLSSLLLAGAASLSCTAAFAADAPYYGGGDSYGVDSGYSTPSAPGNWTGFYAGAHLGYGFGDANSADTDGFLIGVQGGYNWQYNAFLVGLEADISYSGVGYNGLADEYEIDWLGTARGRIGYAFDRFVAYGTGGLAWANAEYDSGVSTDSNTHIGWTLGAGVEAAVTQNISAKAEYLYMDFGDESYSGAGTIESDLHTVRLGVNYRF